MSIVVDMLRKLNISIIHMCKHYDLHKLTALTLWDTFVFDFINHSALWTNTVLSTYTWANFEWITTCCMTI